MLGLALAACQKVELAEDVTAVADGSPVVNFKADGFPSTKVVYEGDTAVKGAWDIDDVIYGFTDKGVTVSFTVADVDESTGAATLEQTTNVALFNGDKVYAIYFPLKSAADIKDGELAVDFSEQPADVVPMLLLSEATAASNTLSFSFRNATSIVGVVNPTMSTGQTKITNCTLCGHEIVSAGKVSVSGGALTFTADAPSKFITKKVPTSYVEGGSGSLSLNTPLYVVVPPCPVEKVSFCVGGNWVMSYVIGKTAVEGKYYLVKDKTFASLMKAPAASGVVVGNVSWAATNLNTETKNGSSAATGDIYQWGNPEKIYSNFNASATPCYTIIPAYTDYGFGAPMPGKNYYSADAYTKYNATDGKTVLDPVDDIVQLTYPGSGWRMPTKEDFDELLKITPVYKSSTATFTDPDGNKVLFYRSAYASITKNGAKGGTGRYWTATTSADNSTCAYYMLISSTGTCTCAISETNSRRCFGYMIRPVKDVAE